MARSNVPLVEETVRATQLGSNSQQHDVPCHRGEQTATDRQHACNNDQRDPQNSSVLFHVQRPFSLAVNFSSICFLFFLLRITAYSPSARRTRPAETVPPQSLLARLWSMRSFMEGIRRPSSYWIPIILTTATVFYTFTATDKPRASYGNVDEFRKSCPVNTGRNQASAFVKLLAATVTTIGINGHLGSLAGAESWKWALARAIEVVMTPLTSLFHFAAALFYEIASSFPPFNRLWPGNADLRYRFARLCRFRVHSCSFPNGLYIGVIHPQHLQKTFKDRSLKWHARLIILAILVAQYSQAAFLLTRRSYSQTAATVDIAMLFMVVSGFVALVQSLVISAINTKWILREDDEPCSHTSCGLPICIDARASAGLKVSTSRFQLFGTTFTGIPRYILNMLAARHLQQCIVERKRKSLYALIAAIFGIHVLWQAALGFLVELDVLWKLFQRSNSGRESTPAAEASSLQYESPTSSNTRTAMARNSVGNGISATAVPPYEPVPIPDAVHISQPGGQHIDPSIVAQHPANEVTDVDSGSSITPLPLYSPSAFARTS